MSRTPIVPALLLAVLQKIKFITIVRTADEISLSALTDRFHTSDRSGLRQFLRLIPPQVHLLHRREVRRTPSFVSIISTIQQIPFIDSRESSCSP